MGHVTKIAITRGRTINMGNYESERVDVTMEVALGEGEDYQAPLDELANQVTEELNDISETIKPGSSR